MPRVSILSITALVSTLQLTACAKSDNADAGNDSATAAEAPAANTTPAAPVTATETTAEASMTVSDIDRWQRGMDAELAAVRELGTKLKTARNSTDTMSVIFGVDETATRARGARAVGLDENRCGLVRSTLSSVVRYMVPLETEMGVENTPAELLASMNKNREEALARTSPKFPAPAGDRAQEAGTDPDGGAPEGGRDGAVGKRHGGRARLPACGYYYLECVSRSWRRAPWRTLCRIVQAMDTPSRIPGQ